MYRLKSTLEDQELGLKRMALDQIDKAIGEIDDQRIDADETIHQVRKRCKKIRALVRLYRDALGKDYRSANAHFRDTARLISRNREAVVRIETYDLLCAHFADQIDRRAFAPIRAALTRQHQAQAREGEGGHDRLAVVRGRLEEGRERVESWALDAAGFDAMRDGLSRTYKRGCHALAEARARPTAEHFHEWRKRVKYHRYHLRLLRPLWPKIVNAYRGQFHRLSDLLGDGHDLMELAAFLGNGDTFGRDEAVVGALGGLARQRAAELHGDAILLGRLLYHERAGRAGDRFATWWSVWSDREGGAGAAASAVVVGSA